ncbi:MAG: hypothetical protein KGZ65_04240 [Sphingomonadales bacterium]|nr:hypothetical protein [Sphingomonadaceae bacterium]MBS3930423.1 hypothetical protein [Sphingomonadales bacterium]
MPPRTAAVIKVVEVKDIIVGDKLLADLVGYKGNVLIHRGVTISAREVTWLKKKLAENAPVRPSIKYRTNVKAIGDIRTKAGVLLVARGTVVEEAVLAPLLKEGFAVVDLMESGSKMFHKSQPWTEKSNVSEFNPAVQVERIELVNDDAKTPVKA